MVTETAVRVYRRSALEAISCPKRFYELYERPDPVEDSSDEALRGSAFHATAHNYIQRLLALKLTTDAEELRGALRDAIVELRVPAHLINEVESLTERWGLTFELDLDAYLLAEETQVLEAAGLQWTPDLVYARGSELEQIDWKTYWAGITDSEVKKQFQAQSYVWMAAQKWPGFERYRFTFNYPRLGYSSTAVWSAAEVEELELIVRSRIDIINACRTSGDWTALPGSMCVYCRLDCPVRDHTSLDVSRATDAGEAAAIAGELLVLDKAAHARRTALKAWCERTGPVTVNGVEWSFTTSDTLTFPATEVIQILDSHGVTDRGFSVTKTALRKYLATKAHEKVGRDLEGIAVRKSRSVFGSRLTKGAD